MHPGEVAILLLVLETGVKRPRGGDSPIKMTGVLIVVPVLGVIICGLVTVRVSKSKMTTVKS